LNYKKEKAAQLELAVENGQLKTRLEELIESNTTLANEKATLSPIYEKEKAARVQFESENIQFRDYWAQINKDLDKEKAGNVSLAREIQDLKRYLKSLEPIQNACNDLSSKCQAQQQILNDEQVKKQELENRFRELHQRYMDLDAKRPEFENLGVFANKLMESVPIFTTKAVQISEQLSIHAELLKTISTHESLKAFEDIKANTESELARQTQVLEKALQTIQLSLESSNGTEETQTDNTTPEVSQN